MKLYIHFLRGVIFTIGLYAFFAINAMMGIVILVSGLFSFLFGFRRYLLLAPSKKADAWEFCGAALILANSLILAFVDYNSPANGWVDIPMHFWGGIFASWWASLVFPREKDGARWVIIILGIAALVGVVWEFFEWTGDNAFGAWFNLPVAQASLNDTMEDLLLDLAGGFAVYTVLRITRRRRQKMAKKEEEANGKNNKDR